jgi:diamine N-acetyltransferase
MTIQIREATADDYSAIASIARESQDIHAQAHPTIFQTDTPGFSEGYVQNLLADEQSAIYVAEEDGSIVGYAFLRAGQLTYLDIFQPQTIAEITDIAITATARRKGIGRLLFEASQEWARSQNAERLELIVWAFNREAIAFYRRNGMSELSHTMSIPLR